MSIVFNADEVFGMAERIEENGAAFYRKAADLKSATDSRQFLLKLADMEDHHKATFAAMRGQLSDAMKGDTAFDPYMEASLYLAAMADAHGGEGSPSVAAGLTENASLDQILRIALGLEEKSIVFYLGIKDMVPEKLGKDKIDAIIAEEKSHIVTLAGELKKVKKA